MRNVPFPPIRIPVLSQTAEHALRAILYLAARQDRGLVSAQEIAGSLGAPANYLGKTLRRLAERRILRSVRGPKGGWALLVDPETLTAAEVVAAFDEPRGPSPCLMGAQPCDPSNPCALHGRWTALAERVVSPLEETTISDLLGNGDLHPTSNSGASKAPRSTS